MQVVSAALESMIDGGVNNTPHDRVWDWAELIELYPSDYALPSDGFLYSSADATLRFSSISKSNYRKEVETGDFIPAYTWNGLDYIRQVVSRGDIKRYMDGSTNNVSLVLSNILRYSASLYLSDAIREGQWIVIRLVSRSIEDSSIVLFTGRLDTAIEIDEETVKVTCKEPLDAFDVEIPRRQFTEDDPEGRHPGDLLYEGFHFNAQIGTFPVDRQETTTSSSFFGLIRKTKTRKWIEHRQYSSKDSTPYGQVLPEVFGQCQMQGIPITFADNGPGVIGLWAFANGVITKFSNTRCITKGWGQPVNQTEHHGFTSDIVDGDNDLPDPLFPNAGYFSKTAYIGLGVEGSSPDVEDDAPEIVSVLLGRIMLLPDADGVFGINYFSDNPAYITRSFLTHPDFLGLPTNIIDDAWTLKTGRACDRPIVDSSNSERVFVPSGLLSGAGTNYNRYYSQSQIHPSFYLKILGLADPSATIVNYDSYNIATPPPYIAPVTILRRQHTCNVSITEKVKATDFLWKTLLPCFRGFITQGANGKYQIRTEEPADSTYLRSDVLAGVTEIPVYDVTEWQASQQGRVLIGSGATSEHIKVLSIKYGTVGNSITLTSSATGGLTAVADNATLEGGNDATQASSFVTIGGTPADALQAIITIDGIQAVHTLTADDTTGTVAAMLAAQVNANTRLNKYVEAVWDVLTPTIVTIRAKLGALVLDEATEFAHEGPKAAPTVAPTLAASTGTLPAGVYYVAPAYRNARGVTTIGPAQNITLLANEQIDVSSYTLPVGMTSIDWYMSNVPGSLILAYIANNDGTAFSINEIPKTTNSFTPASNTTGEETIRIAHAFDASNIIQKSFRWPLGGQTSYNQFVMGFRDASQDFGEAKYVLNSEAHQQKIKKINTLTLDGSAVDNWDQAVRLVRSKAAKEMDGAPRIGKPTHFYTLGSRGRALLMEEGDVVCLTDDTGGKVDGVERLKNVPARVEQVRINEKLEVTLVMRAYSTLMYVDQSHARNIILPSPLEARPDSGGRLLLALTGGTRTLTFNEASNRIIEVSGVLTSNQIIVVPNIVNQWTVTNLTTGAFTLTVKTAAQSIGIPTVAQNTTAFLESDGTNVRRVTDSNTEENLLEAVEPLDANSPIVAGSITAKVQKLDVSVATTTKKGAMSAADKSKLDDATDANAANTLAQRDATGSVGVSKILASDGLGVGNTVSASTPGTVIAQMEVFDEHGTSLGYVPIYDTIT